MNSYQEVNSIFRYIRFQGWKGIILVDPNWVVILGTFQYFGVAHNDNKVKK